MTSYNTWTVKNKWKMAPNKLDMIMFFWSNNWGMNNEGGGQDVISVLGMFSGQEWNTFSVFFKDFACFLRKHILIDFQYHDAKLQI